MGIFVSKKVSVLVSTLLIATGSIASANKDAAYHHRAATLNFTPGGADLSAQDQTKLRDLVNAVGISKIKRVEVAGWSDKEFPQTGSDLAKADRELAEKRISKVKDFLKDDLDVSRVSTYNMAETSNWMARTLRTDDAELKSIFSKEGSAPIMREDFNTITKEGAPSKVVVLAIIDETKKE